ncbi:MAG: energy transducer TonB [Ilyomonas sp.]
MLPKTILQSDLLDILFDNRNKEYGAYQLRKEYSKRLLIALLLVIMLAFIVVVCLQFFLDNKNNTNSLFIMKEELHLTPLDLQPEIPKPKEEKKMHAIKPKASVKLVSNIVLVKNSTELIPTIKALDSSIISNINLDGPASVDEVNPPVSNTTSSGKETINEAVPETPSGPLVKAEIMPHFPGGINAYFKFLQRNLKQPDDLSEGQKILVKVRFIVQADGNISNIEIIQTGRNDLDEEVLGVMRRMPKWIPGVQNGRNIAVYLQQPVTFVPAQ